MKKKLTFEQLCEMEPELKNLYKLASMFVGASNPDIAEDWLWYNIFKPALSELIGYGRLAYPKTRKPEEIKFISFGELMDKKFPTTAKFIKRRNPASESKDKILWTSIAWDVAVDAIMGQIPGWNERGSYLSK